MSWQLFDRLAAFFKGQNLYRRDSLFVDQSNVDRVTVNGQFLNFAQTSALLEQTNLQINRMERYKDFTAADEVGEISLALDLIAEEAALKDPEIKHVLTVKARSKRVKEELENLFYNTLLIDNLMRPMIRYLCKFGDFPAEIVTTQNRTGVMNLKFMTVFNFTRVESKYGDLVGFYFQDKLTTEPVFLHPWQVMHLRLTSFDNGYHPYGRCEKFGTRVLTPNGYKNIESFKPGDDVYVFDNNQLIPTKVIAACHSGEKEIYQVKTRHFENNCSGNHLMLVRKWSKGKSRFGLKWFSRLDYVRADQLEIGDELVVPRVQDQPNYQILGTIQDNNVVADERFAKLFGFLIGDGWLQRHRTSSGDWQLRGIQFARGINEELNQQYGELLSDYSPNKVVNFRSFGSLSVLEETTTRTSATELAKFIQDQCGFIQGSKNKRIPDWVYRSPKSVKMAFIEGLIDSDGSSNIDEWNCERYQIELANYELVKDIKMLVHNIGWKCGQILERNRESEVVSFPSGQECIRSDSWYLYFYKSDLFADAQKSYRFRGNSRKSECQKYGPDVLFEPIVSIDKIGMHLTADIQVDHPASNFIADGVVVHNSMLEGSRKAFKQLRLMEDAALIYRLQYAPEKRVWTIPVGNIPTHEVSGYIENIARQLKKKQFYDPATGDVNERYSPLLSDDNILLPQRADGVGPTVTTLPGAENLDDIKDIEYFKKKMVAPLKIPFDRVGLGESSGSDERSLSQVSPSFAKAIQWIQQEVAVGLKKVAIVHLALAGYNETDMRDFDIHMTASSAIDELYRIETWQSRANVIDSLRATECFPKRWILRRFTDMTDDEIAEMEEELKEAQASGLPGAGGMPGMGGMPGIGGGPLGMPGMEPPELPPPGEMAPLGIETPPEGMVPPEGGGGGIPGAIPEGYNQELEQQVLSEELDRSNRVPKSSKWFGSKSLFHSNLVNESNSGYDNMMNGCEFDGLTRQIGDKEMLMVESYIDKALIKEAKDQTKILIMAEPVSPVEDDEIKPSDIPSRF